MSTQLNRPAVGLGPLANEATAVVVGGGPGGVAAAIALRQGAQALGRTARVILLEGKQFAEEQHHNQCAGVLAPPLKELIEHGLGLPFPAHLSRGTVSGYVLHTAREAIVLDGEAEPAVAVRRVQFDAYMLEAARQRGVETLSTRVTDLEFHADRVVVYTESAPVEAAVVVGAFGLDGGAAGLFARAVGYRPPPTFDAVVTKYHPGQAGMAEFGGRVHAFLPATPGIEFGAITPKGNHLTVNIGGAAVDARRMDAFLRLPEVRRALPALENARRIDPNDLRYFKGHFPGGLARRFFGDRFVLVGDAAGLVRAFKGKGVTSAVLTGQRAAHTILHHGISAGAFERYRAANRDITDDLPVGQALRRLVLLTVRLGWMDAVLRAAAGEPRLRTALFDAVSAHRPYRDVARAAFAPASLRAVLRAMTYPRPRAQTTWPSI